MKIKNDWSYAKGKINCERYFLEEFKKNNFPVIIVRPGHTYDTIIPEAVGNGDWTNISRMIKRKPIIINGDGNNLWTLTHSKDFSECLAELVNMNEAIGQYYHITSNEVLTWNSITQIVIQTIGVKNVDIINISSKLIYKEDINLGEPLIGHKMWCDIYDNTKINHLTGW